MSIYKAKKQAKENPQEAENCEDLVNWTLEDHNLTENEIDELVNYVYNDLDLPR